jgi:hypothetical protein
MTAALTTLSKHRNVLLIDVVLLVALYLVPVLSHLTAIPLYMLEPMRIAVIIALLFTNRTNAYFIAMTIPLASVLLTGHPEPLKAALMCVEFTGLVAIYSFLALKLRMPNIAALAAGILLAKVVYYALKSAALSAGLLAGNLVSTPLKTQLILAIGTVVVFGLFEHFGTQAKRQL